MEHLTLIVVLAVLIYLTRIAGLLLGARQAPPTVARALHYVPIAAFAALIVPGLAVPGEFAPRVVAALCTGLPRGDSASCGWRWSWGWPSTGGCARSGCEHGWIIRGSARSPPPFPASRWLLVHADLGHRPLSAAVSR